jgi:hypothetical protein
MLLKACAASAAGFVVCVERLGGRERGEFM